MSDKRELIQELLIDLIIQTTTPGKWRWAMDFVRRGDKSFVDIWYDKNDGVWVVESNGRDPRFVAWKAEKLEHCKQLCEVLGWRHEVLDGEEASNG